MWIFDKISIFNLFVVLIDFMFHVPQTQLDNLSYF